MTTRPLTLVLATIALALAPAPVIAQSAASTITDAARDNLIVRILAALDRAYVFPEKAAEMRKAVETRRAGGAYARATSGVDLATTLTSDLQGVSHDKHLVVRYLAPGLSPEPVDRVIATLTARMSNYGIGTAQIFSGNVGYVEIRSFGYPAGTIADAVEKAMTVVADADALIIDIRRNGGGTPEAVQLVSSYLFGEEPVLLNSLYFRPDNRTTDFYTLAHVSGKRFGPTKPVYVLTSRSTFSAAEEFAYNLQSRKRAIIVGDTTGGGAHPGGVERIGDFTVFVPSGRATNPITKTNWEGTGVRPEIVVPTDSALNAALAAVARDRRVAPYYLRAFKR